MLRPLLFLISCNTLFISCAQVSPQLEEASILVEEEFFEETAPLDSIQFSLFADTSTNYQGFLSKSAQLSATTKQLYAKARSDSAREAILLSLGKELEQVLVQGIFPYWYGTAWDFNGISNVPGEGQIACGYFVSTTLKHTGLNVNRYKLAQQSSKVACQLLAIGDTVHKLSPTDLDEFKEKNQKLSDGLYCIGLDYHVGFLLKRNGRYFFIHASYVGIDGVSIEPIETSPAFYSQTYYYSALTTNTAWVKLWMNSDRLLVNGK